MNDIPTEFKNKLDPCCCPHCKSTKFIRFGKDGKIQKYSCKQCNKIFRATTGSPIHGMHKKEKAKTYLMALYCGCSVRKAAQRTGISINTSFNWRHKFLTSLVQTFIGENMAEKATVSLIKMKYSAKGRRKEPEKHQKPTKNIQIITEGQIRILKLPPNSTTISANMVLKEQINTTVCTIVPNKMLTAAFSRIPDVNKTLNSKQKRQQMAISRQKTSDMLHWMERFRGVASKYLQQYWSWYSTLNNIKILKEEVPFFMGICFTQRNIDKYRLLKSI